MQINTKYEILTPNGFESFDGIKKTKKKSIEIFFDNELSIRGSFEHLIFDIDNNPIQLKKLKKGDKIKSHDGYLVVDDIKKYYNKINLYDIVNSGKDHVYITNNVISHNCDFLGSGDNVIPKDVLEHIKKNMVKPPEEQYMAGLLWQWKKPIKGHRYIIGVDASRGDSEDYSAINIIDFDDREQVLEYIGKMAPDDLGALAYKWGKMYSAFCVIDITGGMGIATARKMQEFGYKDLYIDGINTKDVWSYDKNIMDKIPGINFNNKRTQIIATFEEQLRHGFILRSERLTDEINTFVFINGRPDHMKGRHDDSIMSIAIAMYAGEICFNQLTRNENQNKAMLESWALNERSYDVNKSFYSYGTALDAIGGMATDNEKIYHDQNPNNVPKEAYKQYAWLFGIPKPK
jgi:hypothetical protein